MEKNQNIYAKIVNGKESSDVATYTISNIDKLLPNQPDIEVVPNKHSMTVNIVKENGDTMATNEYGCSGVREYKYYCTDGERIWESEWTNDKTYKFSEIYGSFDGVNCECYVISKDVAQNESTDTNKMNSKTAIPKPSYYVSNFTGNLVTVGRTDNSSLSWLYNLTSSTGLIYCGRGRNPGALYAGIFTDKYNTAKLIAYGYDMGKIEINYHNMIYYFYEASMGESTSEKNLTFYFKSAKNGIYQVKSYRNEVLDDFYKE